MKKTVCKSLLASFVLLLSIAGISHAITRTLHVRVTTLSNGFLEGTVFATFYGSKGQVTANITLKPPKGTGE